VNNVAVIHSASKSKLAVGYLLDELKNDITKETPACFDPAIDYVVTKIPRFAFEEIPRSKRTGRPCGRPVLFLRPPL
jgi:carbamoylphosphate synthase large subunit